MKTHSERRGFPVRWLILAAWSVGLLLASGCASRTSGRLKRAPALHPPVAGIAEIQRKQQVSLRAGELLNTGRYRTTEEARQVAEREIPASFDPAYSRWAAAQVRWQKQQAEQENFKKKFAQSQLNPVAN